MLEANPGHVYGLSYQPPLRRKGGNRPPELVFRMSVGGWNRVKDFFETKFALERIGAAEYLRRDFTTTWQEPRLAIDPEECFGFDACGYVRVLDGEASIHFPLVSSLVMQTALSLHALLLVMDIVLLAEEEDLVAPSNNRSQFFSVSTRCSPTFPYGHGAGGYVFPTFRKWLFKKGNDPSCDLSPAVEAMKEVYYALHSFESHREEREYKRHMDICFRARINAEGRFILECPGDACDLAIYPDGSDRDLEFWCEFSCHNLDTATQQLTLLSGLAALSDLALKDMEIP